MVRTRMPGSLLRLAPVAVAVSAALLLGACVGPAAKPLADQGADGLPDKDRLWMDVPERESEAATASSAPETEAASTPQSYTVQRGDTLASIAQKLTGRGSNFRAIASANGIANPGSLKVGTELVIPANLFTDRDEQDAAAAKDDGPTVGLVEVLGMAQRWDATFAGAREQYDITRAGIPLARSALLPQAGLQAEIARYTDFGSNGGSSFGIGGGSTGTGGDTGDTGDTTGDGGDTTGDGTNTDVDGNTGAGTEGGVDGVSSVSGAGGLGGDYTQSQIGLSLTQALYDRPNLLSLAAAKLDADIAEVQLLSAHEDLVLRVARAYFDVLRAASELEFRSADLDAIRRQLTQSERRFEVGTIAITDVTEARALRDLAEAAEIDARNTVADAREALVEIAGFRNDDFGLAELDDDFTLQTPDPAEVGAWVKIADQYNTQLIAARGNVDLADDQVDIVRAGRWPKLSVAATAATIDSVDGDSPAAGDTGNIGLQATIPLLTGGQITAQVAQQQAQARFAAEQSKDTERQVVRGTRNAYRGVLAAISRTRALSQALDSTRQAARATQAGFDAGTRTSVEVLQSLRDTFQAQANYASARYDYIVNSLALRQTAGTLTSDDVRRVDEWLAVDG